MRIKIELKLEPTIVLTEFFSFVSTLKYFLTITTTAPTPALCHGNLIIGIFHVHSRFPQSSSSMIVNSRPSINVSAMERNEKALNCLGGMWFNSSISGETQAGVQNPALLLTSCVILGMFFNLSISQFPHQSNGEREEYPLPYRIVMRIK